MLQAYAIKPGSFKDIIDLLIPELRRRGLFHEDYAAPRATYRENLYGKPGQSGPPADHPAAKYRWHAGVEDHQIPEDGESRCPHPAACPVEADGP
ncbi:hypothetical protein BDV11DRAFT_175268 [Aspergillus similis]